MADNRLTVVEPGSVPANRVTIIDLNTHIDRSSDPATNLAERRASISQPGMMVWRSDGSAAYLTAIGSRKLFRVDGTTLDGAGIFGPSRAAPDAVEVGEGPTGVALHEGKNRLYVLNRFSNSVVLVNAATLTRLEEVVLHDPSPPTIRLGRRFLYDGIDGSGHGDAACSSCHISGDNDRLAWDLGDPTGSMVPYSTPLDNVRFAFFGIPCPPELCASHQGFDPQKGPMTTQTLRAMLEPLHWRGDRSTMRAFNAAFVGLMGTEDIGPINGRPAGLTAAQMNLFRDFALGIRMAPNPFRNVNDTLPNTSTQVRGMPFAGNPFNGAAAFDALGSDGGQSCASCHQHPFGSTGGRLGGVEPLEPTSLDATALFNGNADGSPHSDLELPHLRNMHEKFGPRFGPPGGPFPESKTGFGYVHDGSIPDLGTFLSASVFNLTPKQARDITSFMFHFPTGTRPAVGRNLTVPAGTPPTGPPVDEILLDRLIVGVAPDPPLGDLALGSRHCELVAAVQGDGRLRTYFLEGGAWTTDVDGEPQVTTRALRQNAGSPVSFLCTPLGSGVRLGADLDEDTHFNASDCAPADPSAWQAPGPVGGVLLDPGPVTHLAWNAQPTLDGVPVAYEIAGGTLSTVPGNGLGAAGCLAGGLADPAWDDPRTDPPPGEGYFYQIQARKPCGAGGFGPGRESLEPLVCSTP